ncbi:hypothetical protein SeLEV6574_g08104 [Synchytrium endobioticum]|uniref:Uncharacterized protein n=1 Tax=Synchytrium endobioticum TaxID=286115 RepID=A0A507C8Y2_9FUNG|nr:hypothetical protein SeLEV6574_g08104 [Synchytrium endobioticum]
MQPVASLYKTNFIKLDKYDGHKTYAETGQTYAPLKIPEAAPTSSLTANTKAEVIDFKPTGDVIYIYGCHIMGGVLQFQLCVAEAPTSFVLSRAMRSVSTMLTCFIVTLLLWQHALPTIAEITDEQYRHYAESFRRYSLEMTSDQQQQLQDTLLTQYMKWKTQVPYGSGIISIEDLMIHCTIPFDIQHAAQTLWSQVEGMSQSHNEFVWEVLKTFYDFALFLESHNILPAHKEALQTLRGWKLQQQIQLNVQIRLSMGGLDDFFSPVFSSVGMIELNARIAKVNKAVKDRTFVVDSLTQTEFIGMFYRDWCIDKNIHQAVAAAEEESQRGAFLCSDAELYALALSQLVVGRLQLITLSVSAFLEELRSRPQSEWLNYEIVRLESLVTFIQADTEGHQMRADRYMERWSESWRLLLGHDVGEYRQKMESEFKVFVGWGMPQKDFFSPELSQILSQLPVPENVPPTYLELAARYNEVQFHMSPSHSTMELYHIYNAAASAAGPAGGAGSSSNPVMDQQLGVSRVEHDAGHASSSRNRRRHRGSGSQPSLD